MIIEIKRIRLFYNEISRAEMKVVAKTCYKKAPLQASTSFSTDQWATS